MLINHCSLTSLTGCECAVCIVCNITASVARRMAAVCMVGNCDMSRYDGAVSRAGLVPCLHCVLLLSPDVHIHTLPPRAPSCDSYPPAAINLGAAQLGGWGNPSGQKSWTQIVVIASPQISGAWHRAGTAQLCCGRCFRLLQPSIGKT